ncbi:lipid-A-disaccharide synthase [Algivirga pacifica]|uniref:Lipid-A-disaccharide synthase n=1 Tax=Algivirga pacifica TaxID=1162670 RepID=A0ABP9DAM5_9BACT
MRYYLIAGERSGDLHAANLMKALKEQDPQAEFRCWGGDEMEKAGGELVTHYREMAFMGFVEVVKNIFKIKAFLKQCKKDILAYQPDVVIMVDYAGFNLKIAAFAKQKGIKTFYYISPKIWAWNQGRAHKIKRIVDRMFVIMPFEKEFYKRFDYEVDYVGNPLLDAIAQFQPNPDFHEKNKLSPDKPVIAILPGSRKQEVKDMLATMLTIRGKYDQKYQLVVAGVDNLPAELYKEAQEQQMKVIYNQTYDLLAHAEAAVVTSGTATLETALFEVPEVVCYRLSALQYSLVKLLIKVNHISLVNIIAGKEVVKELIQDEFNTTRLTEELDKVLGQNRERILADYKELKQLIHTEGASERAASLMVSYLKEK